MKTHSLSLISGERVPYSISYFPSVIPKDDIVLRNYVSSTPHQCLEPLSVPYPKEEPLLVDKETQTPPRLNQRKLFPDPVPQKPKRLESMPSLRQEERLSYHSPDPLNPENEERGILRYSPGRMGLVGAPLMRSASYEKAILSSMRDYEDSYKIDKKISDRNKSPATSCFLKGCPYGRSKTSETPSSPSPCKETLQASSSLPITNAEEYSQTRKGTFEKWKKRTISLKKPTSSSSSKKEDDNELKLLTHEVLNTSGYSDDEQWLQMQKRGNDHKSNPIPSPKDTKKKSSNDLKEESEKLDEGQQNCIKSSSTLLLVKTVTDVGGDKPQKQDLKTRKVDKLQTKENINIENKIIERCKDNNSKMSNTQVAVVVNVVEKPNSEERSPEERLKPLKKITKSGSDSKRTATILERVTSDSKPENYPLQSEKRIPRSVILLQKSYGCYPGKAFLFYYYVHLNFHIFKFQEHTNVIFVYVYRHSLYYI